MAVDTHQNNFHLTCDEAPFLQAQKVIVPKEAIALQFHEPKDEQKALVVPPVLGGPAAIPADQVSGQLRALTGPSNAPLPVAPPSDGPISVTEAGQAPQASAPGGGVVHVHRRSLDARRGESLADAAVTPQVFLDQVRAVQGSSGGGSTSSVPRSFGPEPVVEEVDEC